MVKFASANDARYPITEIVNMVKRKLGLGIIPTPSTGSNIPLMVLPVPGLPDEISHKDKNEGFSQLSQFDTVFVIDDTGSMQLPAKASDSEAPDTTTRWDVLTTSLQYIADIAAKYDKDGVDIHFLLSKWLNQTNVTSGQEVLNLLEQVDLTQGGGGTYFEPVLAKILGPYVANYQEYFDKVRRRLKAVEPKPLNIIVLTDGKDDEEDATEEMLVRIAKKLDEMSVPRSQVGIQFLQVGDDPEAAIYLEYLDNEIKTKHGVRDVSCIVESVIYFPVLTYCSLWIPRLSRNLTKVKASLKILGGYFWGRLIEGWTS
jgi:hypothetical protein